MFEDITKYRVVYADTDQMGVVYYGNYARFFEIGRTELFRKIGLAYKEVEEKGIIMPVVAMDIKYYTPARYDDILTIKTRIEKMPTSRIVLLHDIYNSSKQLLVKGSVALCFVNREKRKPIKAPQLLLEKLYEVW